jgi:ribosomal protein S18 acetylase RimI-like enzyme
VHSDSVRIRQYQPADLDDLYRICLQTADNGKDATPLFRDPRLPGDVYLAPYVTFEPSLAFVAEDEGGAAGYIVSARDSRAFEQRLNDDWWPKLRVRYPEPSPAEAKALPAPERNALNDIHHPWDTVDELASSFPSHMHIDLLPRLQSRGLGRKLVETLVTALRELGSPGLHLLVGDGNQKAVGFYLHVGFAEVPPERLLPATGLHVFYMDLRA